MDAQQLREVCLALPQAEESFPFGEETAVFKTTGNGKIFALSALHDVHLSVSLKVDPDEGVALRAQFSQITPGYHLNKKHWITVSLDGDGVPDDLVEELIRDSHALVKPKVPRAARVAEAD